MRSLAEAVLERLNTVGLSNGVIVSSVAGSDTSANATVVIRTGPLLLRIVRDRGQEFLELASVEAPTGFHQFDDVEISMGWTSIDEVLAKREPENLGDIFSRLAQRFPELGMALSGDRARLMRSRIEQAERERGEAFLAKLRLLNARHRKGV